MKAIVYSFIVLLHFLAYLPLFCSFVRISNVLSKEPFLGPLRGAPLDFQNIDDLKGKLLQLCDTYKQFESENDYRYESKSAKAQKVSMEEQIRSVIELLAAKNPTVAPLKNWKAGGEQPDQQPSLEGSWKLRFTTAQDAKPRPRKSKSGDSITVRTSQLVNTTAGKLINVLKFDSEDYRKRSLIQVEVFGEKKTENTLLLAFKNVLVIRYKENDEARRPLRFPFPRLPFSNTILSYLNKNRSLGNFLGPYLSIVYLDEDLRVHKTGRGDYFVQTRLYDVWDPLVGWTEISLT